MSIIDGVSTQLDPIRAPFKKRNPTSNQTENDEDVGKFATPVNEKPNLLTVVAPPQPTKLGLAD